MLLLHAMREKCYLPFNFTDQSDQCHGIPQTKVEDPAVAPVLPEVAWVGQWGSHRRCRGCMALQ